MTSAMRIGFIGLGRMGAGMAGRLADAGFPLVVRDVDRQSATALLDKGARWADSPREVAENSDIVCTSLPGPREAEEVFLGADGIVGGAHPALTCIDFSTNAPALVQQIAQELRPHGAEMIDAPVSGGVEGARTGKLTVLIGGDEAALARCGPVLDVLASTVLHVGGVGAASICKVLHNCAVFCANLATIECLTVGVKAGVPAATLVEVFQKSGLGRNLDLQIAMPATLFRGNFEPRFLMSTALKDMGLATELARQCKAPMELADICEREMAAAVERGWGGKDNTIFLTLREERTGAAVRLVDANDGAKRGQKRMMAKKWLTGIDHPVIAIRDMAAAYAAYQRLGFTIPPRGSHIEWGTGNWCIMFPRDYLELRGIVKEGHTHNLEEFLQRRGEGLMGVAFGTDDAEASREALVERGFHPQPVRGLTRNFEVAEGWLQPRFSLCFLEERETAGLMSVVFCQHLTPELLRRPAWLMHANRATGVKSLTGIVDDVPRAAGTHERLFGAAAIERGEDEIIADTGRGFISLCTAAAAVRRYPECKGIADGGGSRLVAVTLTSSDLDLTDKFLKLAAVDFRRTPEGTIVVSPVEACGVVIEFAGE